MLSNLFEQKIIIERNLKIYYELLRNDLIKLILIYIYIYVNVYVYKILKNII